ncbi:MAG: hypothetical protein NC041_08030 [Bacteroides sp.]|nr:hypothetical protein [Prevotella sp.]MCM1408368.1 hypothetical protein [Treponema brennaborense]MCM1470401.1 hypothetical protein [Bacteroides sp.]
MSAALTKMYDALSEDQQKQVYDFILSFYEQNEKSSCGENETYGFGSLKKYANPDLREKEKSAWQTAAEEKHGLLGR